MKRLDNATIEALSGELNPHHTKQTKGKRSNHGRRAARMAGAGLPFFRVVAVPSSHVGQSNGVVAVPVTGLGSMFKAATLRPSGVVADSLRLSAQAAGGPSGVIAGPSAGLSWLSVSGEGSWLPEVA